MKKLNGIDDSFKKLFEEMIQDYLITETEFNNFVGHIKCFLSGLDNIILKEEHKFRNMIRTIESCSNKLEIEKNEDLVEILLDLRDRAERKIYEILQDEMNSKWFCKVS